MAVEPIAGRLEKWPLHWHSGSVAISQRVRSQLQPRRSAVCYEAGLSLDPRPAEAEWVRGKVATLGELWTGHSDKY